MSGVRKKGNMNIQLKKANRNIYKTNQRKVDERGW